MCYIPPWFAVPFDTSKQIRQPHLQVIMIEGELGHIHTLTLFDMIHNSPGWIPEMIWWDLEVQWLQIIHLLPLLLVLRHILQSLLSHPLLQISAPQASMLYITRYWKLKPMSVEIYELNLNFVPNVHGIFRSHRWPSKCYTKYKILHHLFLYMWSAKKTWNKIILSISKHFHMSFQSLNFVNSGSTTASTFPLPCPFTLVKHI